MSTTQVRSPSSSVFAGICEWDNEFLALFPHRFDYIYANHPEPGCTPAWQTERRHPLSDRLIQQGGYLYGVRFGSYTRYCLLDIDVGSPYHPQSDPLAIGRVVATLEAIGLVKYVACSSSYSGGVHLYFPFDLAQSSWELAGVIAALLENAGFALQPGHLELFPNPKPYSSQHQPSLFNAHRLPLQMGSYLLNEDFQPIWSSQQQFVQQWQWAQAHNTIDSQTIKRLLKQIRRQSYQISGKADKFINDLNAEIELGWTGFGQTNRLLGRITMRAYIFNHILTGSNPLSGQALVTEIVNVARSLPGYQDWCRHQHEIEQRALEWARCIENSHYYPYGQEHGKHKAPKVTKTTTTAIKELPSWNQQQAAGARERIHHAIADLLEKNSLPISTTARFRLLTQYGIGGGSLYRHRDLWHPNYLTEHTAESTTSEVSRTHKTIEDFMPKPIDKEIEEKTINESQEESTGRHKQPDRSISPVQDVASSSSTNQALKQSPHQDAEHPEGSAVSPSLFPITGGNVACALAFDLLSLIAIDRIGGNVRRWLKSSDGDS
ncbi:hypothetical protein [Thermocoleostomius sinensis]|uniref:Uncharacterized protein n=1 Tax=Thermocoleostomius sinensis A174 TaxID=2016057 RepID=A0A9E9C6Q3_9CYAN|nr:hypothetical protein [Thermocoleostomius sinensis]WAL58458.1 hypothetical protein OXH18_14830 [Thermocoleostomius sinensis A174]